MTALNCWAAGVKRGWWGAGGGGGGGHMSAGILETVTAGVPQRNTNGKKSCSRAEKALDLNIKRKKRRKKSETSGVENVLPDFSLSCW